MEQFYCTSLNFSTVKTLLSFSFSFSNIPYFILKRFLNNLNYKQETKSIHKFTYKL